jgi:signal transduction histidine kinase
MRHRMMDPVGFRHAGGGRKGLFVVLRYVFIVAASYLVVFQDSGHAVSAGPALMIAIALASNVVLSILPQQYVFAWYIEAPVMVADTLWVSWALHQTGSTGVELFLLYFFVIFLAWVGERTWLALAGSTIVSLVNVYLSNHATVWNSRDLLRIVFFYTVALFYGYVLGQIKHERQRADRGFAWARALEVKVAERTDQLRVLYNASLEASRLKSEFVASISHELRTPLNVILGYTEMLLDPDATADRAEHDRLVLRARAAACSLLQLVDSVLDLGKLDAGKVPVEVEPLALGDWMAEQRERDRIPLQDGVRMRWTVPATLPTVRTDPAKLRIVLDNLVNNAIKFTIRGAITVGARHLLERDVVEIQVEDTGPGIDKADTRKIFEPFHQAPNGRDNAHGGVGLGLAIVDRYVRLLGGKIAVESTLGVGTRFVITLPCGGDATDGTRARAAA